MAMFKLSISPKEVALRVKGQRSGRFNLPATQAPTSSQPSGVFKTLIALAQTILELPLRQKKALAALDDLRKKGVKEGDELDAAQKAVREANGEVATGTMEQAKKLVNLIRGVPGFTQEKAEERKRVQRGFLNAMGRRILPTEENPTPIIQPEALAVVSRVLNQWSPAPAAVAARKAVEEAKKANPKLNREEETGIANKAREACQEPDIFWVLRKESERMSRTLESAVGIAQATDHKFGGGDAFQEVADFAFEYLSKVLEERETARANPERSVEEREAAAGDARLIRDQIAVLSSGLPFSKNQWTEWRQKREAEAKKKAEETAKPAPKPASVPAPKSETKTAEKEETPAAADVDTDNDLGALAALKAKLGITGETGVYLRPVEEALRAGDTVAAATSLADVLTNFGELMPAATREGLNEFLEGLQTDNESATDNTSA